MSYSDYLIQLLKPLGVYDLDESSYSTCELNAVGKAMDDCCAAADTVEREAFVMTAEDYGLAGYEEILPEAYGTDTESRRQAVISMLSVNNGCITPYMLNTILSGCGMTATVEETENKYEVKVTFPDAEGEPDNADRIKAWIERLLPCHLGIVYSYGQS